MVPTLEVGDRFTILKASKGGVGDVVVLTPPVGSETGECGSTPPVGAMCARPTPEAADVKLVKRIVAVGGDRISMRGGRIIRNGRPETTEGPRSCSTDACEFPREIAVPPGHVFVLGDNRGASDDSRFWGPVPEGRVVGRYWFTYS